MAPPSMDSSFRHQDDDDAFYKPPNFDHFLNQRQHQRRPNRPSRSMNAHDFSQSNKANDASNARPNLGNTRIHPTEMQRYLQGLMSNQNNQLPSSSSGSNSNISKVEMLHRLKASLDNGSDPSMVGLSSLNNGINNNNNFGNGGGSSSQQASSGNNGGIKNEPNSNNENKNNGNNSSNNDNSNNSSNNNNQNNNIKRGGNDNLASSFGGIPPSDAGIKNSRQKNDKAVEVHHKDKVIARFRTQTECARYLRATPEAVSYHCSKGGGICNGLVIKPLGASDVAALLSPDRGAQGVDDLPTPRGPCFGLLEGAERFRPKERPQLKPETVAILREWLLSPEHMDNPYPNLRESERLMERTGLDKTQLKHWFNNARKRILKPLLKNGGKKGAPGLGSPSLQEQAGPPKKRGTGGSGSMGPRKKRKNKDDNDGGGSNPLSGAASELGGGLEATTALCGTINSASSNDTNVMSNMSSSHQRQQQMLFEEKRQFELMHQQLLSEERQRIRPRQFDDPFMDNNNLNRGNSDGNGSFNSSGSGNNMMSMNRYERLMGYNNNGMSNMMSQGMMGFGDSMGGMLNDCTPRNSFNDDCGGSSFMRGGGGFQGRGNNMGGMGIGFNGCMEVNDSNNLYDRFSEFSSSRMNRQGFNQDRFNQGFQQDRFNQDRFTQERFNQGLQQERFNQIFNQDGRMNNGDSSPYCQPLHGGSQGNQNLGDPRDASAMPENSTRSNAVFKQQVATMAMNEASTAFEDMEDAFAHAKGILAAARTKRPGSPSVGDPAEDPLVIEANARAKKCQSVAMFKLKVSQRASEEAANAYEGYQRMVDGMGGGAGGGGGSGGVGPEFSL